MTSHELMNWQQLCHEAVVERDPGRLLTLFLKIDRMFAARQVKRVPSPEKEAAQLRVQLRVQQQP